jgi:hypothetical protein
MWRRTHRTHIGGHSVLLTGTRWAYQGSARGLILHRRSATTADLVLPRGVRELAGGR